MQRLPQTMDVVFFSCAYRLSLVGLCIQKNTARACSYMFIMSKRLLPWQRTYLCWPAIFWPAIFCLTLFCLHTSTSLAQAQQYQHVGNPIARVFSIEEHQSGNQIWSVNQYIDGRMLFATGNGLLVWDGENWQRSSTPNNTRVRDISIWQDGNIYAGAVGELGYFSPTDNGEFTFTHIPTDHLLEDFGQTFGVNSNHKMVVFSTDQTVLVWDGKHMQSINQFDGKTTRVFKIGEMLLLEDRQQMYSIDIVNGEPIATPLTWQFPANMRIKSVFLNQQDNVVMVTNMNGVFELDKNTFVQRISPKQLPENYLNSGIQGHDGFYYLNSSRDGLIIFDASFTLMRHYKQADGLGLSTIYNVFQDDQQNIWLAGLPNISVFQPPHIRSKYSSDTGTVDFENIFNIDQSMFFSGTGFYQLTFPNGKTRSPMFTQIPDFNLVVLELLALENALFVGTEAGVYLFDITNVDDQKFMSNPTLISTQDWVSEMAFSSHKFPSDQGSSNKLRSDNQFIYATIGNHLSQFEKINGRWQETRLFEDKSGMEYLSIQAVDDSSEHIWFTTEQQELYRLTMVGNRLDLDSLLKFDNQSAPLGSEHLRPFVYKQRMLIGTQNGVIEYQPTSKSEFTLVNDLTHSFSTLNKDVFKIEIDEKQRIWYHAGTDTGVIYTDDSGSYSAEETFFKPYNRSGTRGLAYFDDAIWFGVANGSIYRLSEKAIHHVPKAAPLTVRYINSINSNIRLPLNLPQPAYSVDNNSMRIGFALADYSSPMKTRYRTQLAGPIDQSWTQWSTETSKDFTLLPGGDYTLSVEAQDVWGRTASTQHGFAVAFPWYLSFWAKIIYLVALLLIIATSIRVGQKLRNKALEQQNRDLELGISERTKEIALKVDELKQQQQLKDRFFSNVSHEFRTPLTLTIGPLETILKECSATLDVQVKNLTFTALNNAKTMLALVGQVLDINRLEVGQLSLRVSQHDMAALLRLNYERFLPWTEQHQQELGLLNCENPHEIYCDVDQIDKCISNLLSNAVKYSGKRTVITLALIHQQKHLGIRITDNGHGIDAANKEQVFDRYYQEELANGESSKGSGIGLALVKELVNLHHGSIDLETEIDQGCQFTIWLPSGKSHFRSEQLIEPTGIKKTIATQDYTNNLPQKDATKILVVDDNAELRQFICQRLSHSFTVIEADNGQSGFVSAMINLPDIIISDIAMPVMSGLELTQKLKRHPETKHIPVLLLSAQAMKRDIVQGFAHGADDYLIKPFDTSELVMRVNTLIKSRRAFVRRKIQMTPELQAAANSSSSFEDNLQKHIFSHLHDVDFTIDMLSQLMFMSKETLRRKCQVSLKISPSAYIHQVRLQQAKLLLQQHQMNISEVAYAVGFDSLSNFSKSFKKYYGLTPSALNLKEKRKDN
jgi:signal transduction histidine kinase/DNA-binding response OmpR family regulator